MDTGKAALVVGIMLAVVVVLHLAIFAMVQRGKGASEAEVARRVLNQALRPLNTADKELDELAQKVAALRAAPPGEHKQDDHSRE